MFKSILNLCKFLDNKKLFKQSDQLFNVIRKASTDDEGKTIEQLENDISSIIKKIGGEGKYVKVPPIVREKYTEDDIPKLQELRNQILSLIDEFKIAMNSGNEDFYANVENFNRYTEMKFKEMQMESNISSAIFKRATKPIMEPKTDAEFDVWNRMNPDFTSFMRESRVFTSIRQRFENDLSYKIPLIHDINRIRPAQSGYQIQFDPKLIELGLMQGTITHNGKMEGGEFFFLVDTPTGKRVIPLPYGAKFQENADGYFDLPYNIIKREDGTLKFQRL